MSEEDTKKGCTATASDWCCTLPEGHEGDHIATTAVETDPENLIGDVCYRWPRDPKERPIPS